MSFHAPNEYRERVVRNAPGLNSDDSFGNNGVFRIPAKEPKRPLALTTIASDGGGWEHVSVSTPVRCPTWEEMCFVKGIFWDEEDVVMQLHPAKSQWVNNYPHCLHLWRPLAVEIPLPPPICVGLSGLTIDDLRRASR